LNIDGLKVGGYSEKKSMFNKIELSITELEIRKTQEEGKEYLAIKGPVAFNKKVVEIAKQEGVEDAYVPEEVD
jgi:hypothetical protein